MFCLICLVLGVTWCQGTMADWLCLCICHSEFLYQLLLSGWWVLLGFLWTLACFLCHMWHAARETLPPALALAARPSPGGFKTGPVAPQGSFTLHRNGSGKRAGPRWHKSSRQAVHNLPIGLQKSADRILPNEQWCLRKSSTSQQCN